MGALAEDKGSAMQDGEGRDEPDEEHVQAFVEKD